MPAPRSLLSVGSATLTIVLSTTASSRLRQRTPKASHLRLLLNIGHSHYVIEHCSLSIGRYASPVSAQVQGTRTRTASVAVTDSLIDAALAILEETGLPGLTVRDVAARAGVAPMCVYSRFGS